MGTVLCVITKNVILVLFTFICKLIFAGPNPISNYTTELKMTTKATS